MGRACECITNRHANIAHETSGTLSALLLLGVGSARVRIQHRTNHQLAYNTGADAYPRANTRIYVLCNLLSHPSRTFYILSRRVHLSVLYIMVWWIDVTLRLSPLQRPRITR